MHPRSCGFNRGHKSLAQYLKDKNIALWMVPLLISCMYFSDYFQEFGYYFKASLIEMTPTEFTGTVDPIEKVPNWVALSDAERKMTYDQLPKSKLIDIPVYDPSAFVSGQDWRGSSDDARNAYITYPVPNLGNYKLDGTENSGSHTGIDIKAPKGTPVRSIANGIVYKVGEQTSGFGKYVSIAHVQIPDPKYADKKTTIYSNYAHLDRINVAEGEKITKGQVIGKVGDTGAATTAHLHFQIDTADAPFHPYWPFQWADVQAAGLNSYFEAVKHGVGRDNAERYTYHPTDYIAKFDNYVPSNLMASTVVLDSAVATEDSEQSTENKEEVENNEQLAMNNEQTEENVEESKAEENSAIRVPSSEIENPEDLEIIFETDRSYVPGKEEIVKIRVNEANLVAQNGILIDSTLRGMADVEPKSLSASDFTDNVAEVRVSADSSRTFKLIAKGDFGEVKSQSLRPQIFADVESNYTYADAISYLKENEIVVGYDDGSFKPDGTLNRAEAVKILLKGNDIEAGPGSTSFPDVPASAWFADFVVTAADKKIVKGYGDGSFKPGNTITRAEFLKVAILTAGFEPGEITSEPYQDVNLDAWYAPYFGFAKTHSLLRLKKGGFIAPNIPITRAEAADVMYRLSKINKR